MGKYKTSRNKAIFDGMFPQSLPQAKTGGETKCEESHMDHISEPQKQILDKIWNWIDSLDDE